MISTLICSVLSFLMGMLARPLWDYLRAPPVEHRTVDGGHLCPHKGMTDEDLEDFELDMKVPNPTFPNGRRP